MTWLSRQARPVLSRGNRILTALVASAGVACQIVQRSDPRFSFLYFTVDSVLLLGGVLLVGVFHPLGSVLAAVRGAAVVGVVVSAIVFATVIVPNSDTGSWLDLSDARASAATVLMHGVTPVLAVLDDVLHPHESAGHGWGWVLRTMVWPLAYIALVGGLAAIGVAQMPYTFLQPDAVGAGTVTLAVVVILAIIVAVSWVVLWMRTVTRLCLR